MLKHLYLFLMPLGPWCKHRTILNLHLLLGHRATGIHPGTGGHPREQGSSTLMSPEFLGMLGNSITQGCCWTLMKAKCSLCYWHLDHSPYILYASKHTGLPRSWQCVLPSPAVHKAEAFGYSLSHKTASLSRVSFLLSVLLFVCSI